MQYAIRNVLNSMVGSLAIFGCFSYEKAANLSCMFSFKQFAIFSDIDALISAEAMLELDKYFNVTNAFTKKRAVA